MPSLKQLAIKGAIWSFASYGSSQIIRFGSNLILTRLLVPDLFGLMALIYTFITGLTLFSDVGVGPSIIQNQRGEERGFLDTAWTIQVARGIVLWLGTCALAWPVAQFYGDRQSGDQLLWLLPIVGLTTIITGLESTNRFTLQRNLAVRNLAIFELGGQLIGSTILMIWAWISPTIWALVGGNLVVSLIQMVWSHILIPNSWNRFHWDPTAAKEIFSFGQWIFISTASTFLASQADRLILGKLFTFQLLGIYTIAFTLSDVPRQIALATSNKVIFPVFSKLAHLSRTEFRAKILKNRWPVLLILAGGLGLLTGFGDLLIQFLYDDRYDQAAWMLPILALGIWPTVLTQTIDPALFALGESKYVALGNVLKFVFMVMMLPLVHARFGVPGVVGVVAFNDIPFYLAISYGLCREGLNSLVQDLLTTMALVLFTAGLILIRLLLGFGSPFAGLTLSLTR